MHLLLKKITIYYVLPALIGLLCLTYPAFGSSEKSRCPITEFFQSIMKLESKYAKLPKALKTTYELRDVFTPEMVRISELALKIRPEEIKKEIEVTRQKNIISTGKYENFFTDLDQMPWTAREIGRSLQIRSKELEKGFEDVSREFPPPPYSGKHSKFITGLTKSAEVDPDWEKVRHSIDAAWHTLNPIGEYGSEFSESLLHTQSILKRLIFDTYHQEGKIIFKENQFLLKYHTGRGHFDNENGPLTAMLEGLSSINHAIGVILAKKIPGIDNYRDAMRLLIKAEGSKNANGLLAEFSGRLPMGIIGPANFTGRYFPDAIVNESGKLKLSDSLLESLASARKKHHKHIEHYGSSWATGLGVGCPIFHTKGSEFKKSGMQHLFETYLHVFEMVDDHLHIKNSALLKPTKSQ